MPVDFRMIQSLVPLIPATGVDVQVAATFVLESAVAVGISVASEHLNWMGLASLFRSPKSDFSRWLEANRIDPVKQAADVDKLRVVFALLQNSRLKDFRIIPPKDIFIDTSVDRGRGRGSKDEAAPMHNRGVYRGHISGESKPVLIKWIDNGSDMDVTPLETVRNYAILSALDLGFKFYGIVEGPRKNYVGIVMEELQDGLSVADLILREEEAPNYKLRFQRKTLDDLQEIRRWFSLLECSGDDFDALLMPDGRLKVIDPSEYRFLSRDGNSCDELDGYLYDWVFEKEFIAPALLNNAECSRIYAHHLRSEKLDFRSFENRGFPFCPVTREDMAMAKINYHGLAADLEKRIRRHKKWKDVSDDLLAEALDTQQPASALPERRLLPLVTQDGTEIHYPFRNTVVEWKDFGPQLSERLQVLKVIDRDKKYVPAALGKSPSRLSGKEIHEGNNNSVLKFARTSRDAERLFVLQGVLEKMQLPHWPLLKDPVTLVMAREGVVVQKKFPIGTLSLDDIARGGENETWKDVEAQVRVRCGVKALSSLRALREQLDKLEEDMTLKYECFYRGYTVSDDFAVRHSLDSATIIDSLGGGNWGANIFWHPSIGWFLGGW